ncbi:MAG: DNA internalization-related competence protein ComEC/Rec2 [Gallionella sp.]|nr:DNA internalization-related competence protein ComEC/Rec2 [Gallionella sp.]
MVLFTLSFTFGVWLLQQQATLPDIGWAWLLVIPLSLLIITGNSRAGASWPATLSQARGERIKEGREPARSHLWQKIFRPLLIAACACGLGFYHAAWQAQQRLSISLADQWQGRDIEVIGVVAELPRSSDRGLRFAFNVEQTLTRVPGQKPVLSFVEGLSVPQARVPPHIYLSTYSAPQDAPLALRAGERWQLTLRLKQPHGSSNPHGFDFEAWALENKVRAVGYVQAKGDNHRIDAAASGLMYRIESWRETVREKFNATLAGAPYVGVLSALAIGDQGSIPQSQWQVFTRTGVNHLMSISGLHITMLASLGFALTHWLWRRSVRLTLWLPARRAAALVALLVALGYALLSGYGVPAQRTVYMVGAVAAALWLKRNFSLGQILSIALLGVLLPDPWAVLSPGFWLSFGAVALILYVTAHRVARSHWLKEYAIVQWAMTIGLVPMLLALFQQVSVVSPVANAFAIPLVSLVVVPLSLLGAVLPWNAPLWLAHIVMGFTMTILEWLNALPQAVWTQHAPPAWSIVTGMLGVLLILAPRGIPARWLGLVLMLPMFLNTPGSPAPNTLRMIIFDVGQGLAVAVQTHDHALLFDTGPDFSGDADSGNRILVPALRALGIDRLDGLILSHDDLDHTGGTTSVMQAMPIDWVASSLPDDSPLLQNFPHQAGQEMKGSRHCTDGDHWQWDGVQFNILHPRPNADTSIKPHDNDLSCVLRISIGSQHILIVGDIEKNSEQRLLETHAEQLPASLLVVPHHGSKTSSTPDFVAAVLPDYAVFTTGYRNRYGHPKAEIVQRYADSGAELLRSDEDGAILVAMDARGLTVERYRKTHQRYWTHQAYEQY